MPRSAPRTGLAVSTAATPSTPTTRLGSNLANQEYQNWIKNLSPYQEAALQATRARPASSRIATGDAGLETGQVGAINTLDGNLGKITTDAARRCLASSAA